MLKKAKQVFHNKFKTAITNKSFKMTNLSSKHHTLFSLTHHCCQTKNLKATKILHSHLLRTNLLFTSLNLHPNLLLSYTTCLPNHNNLQNFLNSINPTNPLPFNAIISCFARYGFPSLALQALSFMHLNSIEIDSYALCSALTASSSVEFGKQVHTHVVKMGFLSSVYVGSALIDLYARVGLVRAASNLFDEIPVRSTVCANALISGFVESKMWGEGLGFSRRMSALGLGYDGFTLCAVLRVCTGLSAVGLGKEVHAVLISTVCDVGGDVFLQSSLIEMYGKSGFVDKARYVFDLEGIERVGERKRDVVLWTTMLGVYSRNGKFEEVIELYGEMLGEGTKPDRVVFVAVISACGNTGNVSLGLEYFNSMVRDFGLEPQSEHYGCVVNMLCRTGKLDKAWKLVNKMPFEIGCSSGSISMWGALLSACAECGNVEMGKLAAKRTLELDPQNVGIYVLLSNLYAGVGMWDEIRELRKVMQEKGLKKDVGYSWVDVNRKLI